MMPRKAGAPSVLDNLVDAAIPSRPPAPTTPEKGVVNKGEVIPPKPHILAPNVNAIPPELRVIRAWVAWRLALRVDKKTGERKWTKEPINPATGGLAATDDSSTWSDLKTALWRMRCGCDGIGLCRTDDYLFIDLDGCLDANGKLKPFPWARKILDAVSGRAYIEKSVSGTGIHAVCRGNLPPGPGRQWDDPVLEHTGFAFYDKARYFTFSGRVWSQAGAIQRQCPSVT